MRCYPTSEVNFRVEYSYGWERYCRWPNKKWKYKDSSPTTTIAYWRDLEGAKKEQILMADLFFDNWLKTRLREGACLPLLYAVGNRFIRLEKDFPAGFRCTPLPMNLKEYRETQAIIKEEAKKKKGKKGKKGKGKKGKGGAKEKNGKK